MVLFIPWIDFFGFIQIFFDMFNYLRIFNWLSSNFDILSSAAFILLFKLSVVFFSPSIFHCLWKVSWRFFVFTVWELLHSFILQLSIWSGLLYVLGEALAPLSEMFLIFLLFPMIFQICVLSYGYQIMCLLPLMGCWRFLIFTWKLTVPLLQKG